MDKSKLVTVMTLSGALVGIILLQKVMASTSSDFTNAVKAGLLTQQVKPAIVGLKTEIEGGENEQAGDSNKKSIPEVNIEKRIETEIQTEQKDAAKESSNSAVSPDSNKSSEASTSPDNSSSSSKPDSGN